MNGRRQTTTDSGDERSAPLSTWGWIGFDRRASSSRACRPNAIPTLWWPRNFPKKMSNFQGYLRVIETCCRSWIRSITNVHDIVLWPHLKAKHAQPWRDCRGRPTMEVSIRQGLCRPSWTQPGQRGYGRVWRWLCATRTSWNPEVNREQTRTWTFSWNRILGFWHETANFSDGQNPSMATQFIHVSCIYRDVNKPL